MGNMETAPLFPIGQQESHLEQIFLKLTSSDHDVLHLCTLGHKVR